MAKYIELETAKRFFNENFGGVSHAVIAARLLNEIPPAADVAPVAHGKWTPGIEECPVCGENKFKDLDADIWADWQPPFCPNCGVKMDGGAGCETD